MNEDHEVTRAAWPPAIEHSKLAPETHNLVPVQAQPADHKLAPLRKTTVLAAKSHWKAICRATLAVPFGTPA
jgi:hypothetical protein